MIATTTPAPLILPAGHDDPPQLCGKDPYLQAAETACAAFIAVNVTLGGDDFKPSPSEEKVLTAAARRYCAEKGFEQVPTWLELSAVLSLYYAARLSKPERRRSIAERVRGIFKRKAKA